MTQNESETKAIDNSCRPRVLISSITFNDGTKLTLKPNSIIVFTGANNCGKSQVLKDIENCFDAEEKRLSIIVDSLEFGLCGELDDVFFNEHFNVNQYGYLEPYAGGPSENKDTLLNDWESSRLSRVLHNLFIKRISTEMRLNVSNNLWRGSPEALAHPIYKLMKNSSLSESLSAYFREAFSVDLIVNQNEFMTVSLYIGEAPDKSQFTLDKQDDYYKIVETLPKLQDQGDGMRSFASILLDSFTAEHSITLIDEPEAFLHPPQARILGKMLGKNNSETRQLIISTHSQDFLQGILDANYDDLTIIRINRVGNINHMNVLRNDEITHLWTNPILRYSNILSGLFHEMVVVCESDYDCLFYQAVIDAIYEARGEVAPDILFTHCGGKARIKDVVQALKAVNVPVVAICDFDILNNSHELKPLVKAFGIDWNTELSSGMKTIYDAMHAKESKGVDAWGDIKRMGKEYLDGNARAAYETVEAVCQNAGLFIVPCGEMECFDKTIRKEKKEWVYYVLESYDLATDSRMRDVREFVQSVVDYDTSVPFDSAEAEQANL